MVTRLGMMLISIIAGAALAVGAAFAISSVLVSANQTPVQQQLHNYGTR